MRRPELILAVNNKRAYFWKKKKYFRKYYTKFSKFTRTGTSLVLEPTDAVGTAVDLVPTS